MNRATLIEAQRSAKDQFEQLPGQLEASEQDKFAAQLYQPDGNAGQRASDATSSADRPLDPRK
jgi:hypothetical protein